MTHIDKAKLLEWLKAEYERKKELSETHPQDGYKLIAAGDYSTCDVIMGLVESGTFDLLPTDEEADTCKVCGGSGFSGLAALAGNGYDAVCDNCGGGGEVPKGTDVDEDVKEIEKLVDDCESHVTGNWAEGLNIDGQRKLVDATCALLAKLAEKEAEVERWIVGTREANEDYTRLEQQFNQVIEALEEIASTWSVDHVYRDIANGALQSIRGEPHDHT